MTTQHPLVGDIAQQGVLEEELPVVVEGRLLPLVHHVASAQPVERLTGRHLDLGADRVAVVAE